MRHLMSATLACVLSIALAPPLAEAQQDGAAAAATVASDALGKDLAAVRLVPRRPANSADRFDDPVGDGIAIGALVGAAAGIGTTAISFSRCGAGCEAPAMGPVYLTAAAVCGGGGAVVGWLIDRAHKRRPPTAAAWRVSPGMVGQRKSVSVTWAF